MTTTPGLHPADAAQSSWDSRTVNELVAGELGRLVGAEEDLMGVACRDALLPPGKLLRPRLCMWSAAAVGGRMEQILSFAAGLECMHVATLMHDDVVDRAPERRGRPSSAEHFGISVALMAGDGLASTAYEAMLASTDAGLPDPRVVRATRTVAAAVKRTVAAIAEETLVREDLSCTLTKVLEIIRGKTGALFGAACQAGAILADAPAAHEDALRIFGEELGMAFQIRDDLLPYIGAAESGGLTDVANRQPTVPVLLARDATSAQDLDRLQELFLDDSDTVTAHRLLAQILTGSGAVDQAAEMARGYAAKAREALAELPPSQARDALEALTVTLVDP
ncbi:polyprenyl synthetase family protein [Kitasatospora aureofaciens]|uniref:polyprenyl synthetase family protein n=1 Tax=Kitasatospora aureofaciens TaxID=1894 RepID=UPI00069049FA|nr:polyprenyl synthetase family protein [Kitasatospora aureofaciens]